MGLGKWVGVVKVLLDIGLSISALTGSNNWRLAVLFVGYAIADGAAVAML